MAAEKRRGSTVLQPTRFRALAQPTLRRHNLSVVLRHLRDHGSASRAQLAAAASMTRTGSTKIVEDLLRRGLVVELGPRAPGHGADPGGPWSSTPRPGRPSELYDLSADRAEPRDLAAEHLDVVRDLECEWDRWAAEHGVKPWEEIVSLCQERGMTRQDAQN